MISNTTYFAQVAKFIEEQIQERDKKLDDELRLRMEEQRKIKLEEVQKHKELKRIQEEEEKKQAEERQAKIIGNALNYYHSFFISLF